MTGPILIGLILIVVLALLLIKFEKLLREAYIQISHLETTIEIKDDYFNEVLEHRSYYLSKSLGLEAELRYEMTGILYDEKTDTLIPREDMIRVGKY